MRVVGGGATPMQHQEIKEQIKRGQSLEDRQLTRPLSLSATGTLGAAAAAATAAGAAPASDSAMAAGCLSSASRRGVSNRVCGVRWAMRLQQTDGGGGRRVV
jgi:hypothetical protein